MSVKTLLGPGDEDEQADRERARGRARSVRRAQRRAAGGGETPAISVAEQRLRVGDVGAAARPVPAARREGPSSGAGAEVPDERRRRG